MKISEVKFYNAVKVGKEELSTASIYEGVNNKPAYEIELIDNSLIKVKQVGTNEVAYSSLYNTVWFKELIAFPETILVPVGTFDANKIRPENSKRDVVTGEDKDRRRHIPKAK